MRPKSADWYKKIWSLDIKNMSWVEETETQVDFIIRTLGLSGTERILDLACGYGRHALSLARRGFSVVGVDITEVYIDDARKTAQGMTNAAFILSDIRDVCFCEEFDVVLSLADGAIGYLESDEENLKIFDVIARALKPGGKHFMDVCNAEHAEAFFPRRGWEIGEKEFSFSEFEWDPATRRMLFGGGGFTYGEIAQKPQQLEGDPTRLYSLDELAVILRERGMRIVSAFSDYAGKEASPKALQLMVYSVKE
ncbi:MAG: methyltransferase domain-containing protein [Bacillota bacterium]